MVISLFPIVTPPQELNSTKDGAISRFLATSRPNPSPLREAALTTSPTTARLNFYDHQTFLRTHLKGDQMDRIPHMHMNDQLPKNAIDALIVRLALLSKVLICMKTAQAV